MGERVAKRRRRGTRYKARRRAVDFLFEAEARDVDPVAIVEDRIDLSRGQANQVAPVKDYTQQIVSGVAEELDGVDMAISRYLSEEWELDRLPAVDRAILRVAVWELLYNEDVPAPAAVTQGVELASEYSNDSAAAYINAVLDDVAHHAAELREEAASDGTSDLTEPAVPEDLETTGPFGERRADTGIEAVGVEGVEPHHADSTWPVEGRAQGVSADEPRADDD